MEEVRAANQRSAFSLSFTLALYISNGFGLSFEIGVLQKNFLKYTIVLLTLSTVNPALKIIIFIVEEESHAVLIWWDFGLTNLKNVTISVRNWVWLEIERKIKIHSIIFNEASRSARHRNHWTGDLKETLKPITEISSTFWLSPIVIGPSISNPGLIPSHS